MTVTGLLGLTILIMTQCGCAFGSSVSQLESTVRVQPGLSTSLECQTRLDEDFYLFWIKIPPNEAPVCVATVKTITDDVTMCQQFKNHSRIKVTWNKKTFNLSFSSVEQTDVATYFCGTYNFREFFFGEGSKLILDEHPDAASPNTPIRDTEEKDGQLQVYAYLVPALAATNVLASVLLVIWLCLLLKKNRSGVTGEAKDVGNKTDEVNYVALTFRDKQRRTVQRRTDVDTADIYGAVQHQEQI